MIVIVRSQGMQDVAVLKSGVSHTVHSLAGRSNEIKQGHAAANHPTSRMESRGVSR